MFRNTIYFNLSGYIFPVVANNYFKFRSCLVLRIALVIMKNLRECNEELK